MLYPTSLPIEELTYLGHAIVTADVSNPAKLYKSGWTFLGYVGYVGPGEPTDNPTPKVWGDSPVEDISHEQAATIIEEVKSAQASGAKLGGNGNLLKLAKFVMKWLPTILQFLPLVLDENNAE